MFYVFVQCGYVLCVSSIVGFFLVFLFVFYVVSKHVVDGFFYILCLEFVFVGVCVGVVYFGVIDIDMVCDIIVMLVVVVVWCSVFLLFGRSILVGSVGVVIVCGIEKRFEWVYIFSWMFGLLLFICGFIAFVGRFIVLYLLFV